MNKLDTKESNTRQFNKLQYRCNTSRGGQTLNFTGQNKIQLIYINF